MKADFRQGARHVLGASTSSDPNANASPAPSAPPAWATALRNRQALSHGASIAAHTLRSGDGGGGGASIDLSHKD
jgi:type IV secretion system protein TrbL